ncbi:MAG: helix-turn-helix transcriptional regulator [Alphaproteobacteria bacterium]|jgi:y4mF family transcriptional regulator|nr:helix-turn-helix transcriptional regulator [Alphaproteobacteria bacterium]MBT5389435.1 helix-turn-helix transcriptional regulator [Alphaproteobacteria bacterium]MBT5540983.1 helix-turn-helix transcriptional regulator [Alphaproteobacteria bacterium]MBT5654989.1 helix-turn-helix transcriptional regulator [Alphaproteobacteria bacterium]
MTILTNIKQLGQIIQQGRKAQTLTQEQLSAISGVGVRFIRELEHGKESCHIGKALQVIRMLGINLIIEE